MKELDAAQRQVRKALETRKASIEKNFAEAKEFYTPGNLINTAVGDFIPLFDWKVAALTLISSLRSKVNR